MGCLVYLLYELSTANAVMTINISQNILNFKTRTILYNINIHGIESDLTSK